MFEEKVNFLLKGSVGKQSTKKRTIIFNKSISKNKFIKDSFKRKDVPHKCFLEEFDLLIVNNNLPI